MHADEQRAWLYVLLVYCLSVALAVLVPVLAGVPLLEALALAPWVCALLVLAWVVVSGWWAERQAARVEPVWICLQCQRLIDQGNEVHLPGAVYCRACYEYVVLPAAGGGGDDGPES